MGVTFTHSTNFSISVVPENWAAGPLFFTNWALCGLNITLYSSLTRALRSCIYVFIWGDYGTLSHKRSLSEFSSKDYYEYCCCYLCDLIWSHRDLARDWIPKIESRLFVSSWHSHSLGGHRRLSKNDSSSPPHRHIKHVEGDLFTMDSLSEMLEGLEML